MRLDGDHFDLWANVLLHAISVVLCLSFFHIIYILFDLCFVMILCMISELIGTTNLSDTIAWHLNKLSMSTCAERSRSKLNGLYIAQYPP